jgi:predicted phosphodiesterase
MRRRQAVALLGALGLPTAPCPFLADPYLNLGPHPADPTRLTLLFHAPENTGPYTVRTPRHQTTAIARGQVYTATLTNLTPNQLFQYEIANKNGSIYHATAKALPAKAQPFRMVLFGDSGQQNPALKTIAAQAEAQNPDVFLHLGDIAYPNGTPAEYRTNFFPIYRFLRTRPSLSVPGNHDIDNSIAWYDYWSQPRNGPGNNYSVDLGDTHWVMLDSNTHANLQDPALHRWLDHDLKTTTAPWRLVAIHHPPFTSGAHHFAEQQSRALCHIFQQNNVHAVFSGHDHNYQRSHPLLYRNSNIEITPAGIPYIISGGAGADLSDAANKPQPYTNITKTAHSFTVLDITSEKLELTQIDATGNEIDALTLTSQTQSVLSYSAKRPPVLP